MICPKPSQNGALAKPRAQVPHHLCAAFRSMLVSVDAVSTGKAIPSLKLARNIHVRPGKLKTWEVSTGVSSSGALKSRTCIGEKPEHCHKHPCLRPCSSGYAECVRNFMAYGHQPAEQLEITPAPAALALSAASSYELGSYLSRNHAACMTLLAPTPFPSLRNSQGALGPANCEV